MFFENMGITYMILDTAIDREPILSNCPRVWVFL